MRTFAHGPFLDFNPARVETERAIRGRADGTEFAPEPARRLAGCLVIVEPLHVARGRFLVHMMNRRRFLMVLYGSVAPWNARSVHPRSARSVHHMNKTITGRFARTARLDHLDLTDIHKPLYGLRNGPNCYPCLMGNRPLSRPTEAILVRMVREGDENEAGKATGLGSVKHPGDGLNAHRVHLPMSASPR